MKLPFLVAIHHILKHMICTMGNKAPTKFLDLEVSPQITCIKVRGRRKESKAKDLLRETKQVTERMESREDRKNQGKIRGSQGSEAPDLLPTYVRSLQCYWISFLCLYLKNRQARCSQRGKEIQYCSPKPKCHHGKSTLF